MVTTIGAADNVSGQLRFLNLQTAREFSSVLLRECGVVVVSGEGLDQQLMCALPTQCRTTSLLAEFRNLGSSVWDIRDSPLEMFVSALRVQRREPWFKRRKRMSIKKLILMFTTLIAFTCTIAAQEQTPGQSQKVIQHVPVKSTSPASGKEMYTTYCAVCHGTDGKGGGPAASALKTPPTDLTMLSKNNGGKFPAMKVMSAIRGESGLPAHGSREMPVWGSLFWSMSARHEGEVQQRVANLTKYIESLQEK